MKRTFLLLLTLLPGLLSAQSIDTLQVQSESFGETREVYVHLPEFYRYQSQEVKLPVFYVLDGQHEWFVNPTLSTIQYLQYTHEIPQAIVVVIPFADRNKACGIESLSGPILPLHTFITQELSAQLSQKYPLNGFNLLVGHSFSASFGLYSFAKAPEFYSAIFAHSPLDKINALVNNLTTRKLDLSKIFLSIGGSHPAKDKYHRAAYEEVKQQVPAFFEAVSLYEANQSTHNAVPILANPYFFTQLFAPYSTRFAQIAEVDLNYKLVKQPVSVEEEMEQIHAATQFRGRQFAPELPELNGIASRYLSNELPIYATAVYQQAVQLYPNYFEFQLYLGELLLDQSPQDALQHLTKAKALIEEFEPDLEEKKMWMKGIDELIREATQAK